MIHRITPARPLSRIRQPKWFNSTVKPYHGTIANIRTHIPEFERWGFGLPQPGCQRSALNKRLDTIVRCPFEDDDNFMPVGVVSKDYALVPHTEVLDFAEQALDGAGIAPTDVEVDLKISEYGERMALSLFLPNKYAFDPGDGHPMALRLECINSVDGSTRFRALMGWFRLVCSNGLVLGVTKSDMGRRHVGDFQLEDIGKVLVLGIKESDTEKGNFDRWHKTPVTLKKLAPWADGPLSKTWGFKAATRAFHIARMGSDVNITGLYKDNTPTTIAVCETDHVPGAPEQSRNLYDVSQILAWLAKERCDLQEQIEWREQIPELMKSLN
jgi:hypothetical protein